MTTLIWKELRETVRWLPLGWLLMMCLVWSAMPSLLDLIGASSVSRSLWSGSCIGAAAVAAGLALAQFAFDQRDSARGFLLHRGVTPQQVYFAKISVGMLVYAISVIMPLLIAAFYLEWIGPERLPTAWWQTVPALVSAFYVFAFYFGTVMVICRPARWIGSRLLPMLAAMVVAWQSAAIHSIALGVGAVCFLLLERAARYSFTNQAQSPNPSMSSRSPFATKLALTAGSILATMLVSLLAIPFATSSYLSIEADRSGELYLVKRAPGRNGSRLTKRVRLENDAEVELLDSGKSSTHYVQRLERVSNAMMPSWDSRYLFGEYYLAGNQSGDEDSQWDSPNVCNLGGYLVAYQFARHQDGFMLKSVYNGAAFSPDWNSKGELHKMLGVSGDISRNELIIPIVGEQGLFFVDFRRESVNWLNKGTVELFSFHQMTTLDENGKRSITHIATKSGDVISMHHFTQKGSSEPSLEQSATLKVDSSDAKEQSLWFMSDQKWTYVARLGFEKFRVTKRSENDESPRTFDFIIPPDMSVYATPGEQRTAMMFCAMAPLAFVSFLSSVRTVHSPSIWDLPIGWEWMVACLVCSVLVSMLAAFFAARHRRLSPFATAIWIALGALFGLGSSLAILSIYPRIMRVPCAKCDHHRRVDIDLCEHCGGGWQSGTITGIEIMERRDDSSSRKPEIATSLSP
ncbi:MAG: hypothetical protein ABL921_26050 [Pirellula sp.]